MFMTITFIVAIIVMEEPSFNFHFSEEKAEVKCFPQKHEVI